MEGKKKGRMNEQQIREHPIRARMLALYEEDSERSLAPSDLQGELDPDLGLSLVAYHVRVLQSAKLLPAP